MNKSYILIFILVMATVGVLAWRLQNEKEIAATVNGQKIFTEDVAREMVVLRVEKHAASGITSEQVSSYRRQSLERLIARELVLPRNSRQAVQESMETDKTVIIEQLKQIDGGLCDYQYFVQRQQELNAVQEKLEEMTKNTPAPTEEVARRYYDFNPRLKNQPAGVVIYKASIQKGELSQAKASVKLRSALQSKNPPADISLVKIRYVVDPKFPIPGVLTGLVKGNKEYSEVVEEGDVWVLYRTIDREPSKVIPFDSVKDRVISYLYEKARRDARAALLAQLRAEARIVINPEYL